MEEIKKKLEALMDGVKPDPNYDEKVFPILAEQHLEAYRKIYDELTAIINEWTENKVWFSCEEALPVGDENHVYCLVRHTIWGLVVRPYSQRHKCWDGEDGDDYETDAVGGKITHWRYLPDGPKLNDK